jgi:hypothetical protein
VADACCLASNREFAIVAGLDEAARRRFLSGRIRCGVDAQPAARIAMEMMSIVFAMVPMI